MLNTDKGKGPPARTKATHNIVYDFDGKIHDILRDDYVFQRPFSCVIYVDLFYSTSILI